MKTIFSTVLVLSVLFASAQKQVISDENAQERQVSAFHAIKVSHAIDVYISQGNEYGLAVSAKTDEYRDKIKTVVEGGVLKIYYDEKSWRGGGNRQLKAYVSVKTLDYISASGACDVTVTGALQSDKLEIKMSGASDFKGKVHTGFLKAELSGASDATISGRADGLDVKASGASDFKGYDLVSEKANASASGASDIKITVNKELNAEASGASGVNYKGSGMIRDIKSSGASSVSRKS